MAGITGELRAWADEFPLHGGPLACVLACADRIDERHEDELGAARAKAEAEYDGWYPPCEVDGMRKYAERLEAAAAERADVTIFGVDYMACPLDADGVPIRVGDKLTDGEYTFVVDELAAFGDGSWSIRNEDGNAWVACDVTHHRDQTVEDVLREFGAGWYERMRGPETFDIADYVERYAAKLRLAGDE